MKIYDESVNRKLKIFMFIVAFTIVQDVLLAILYNRLGINTMLIKLAFYMKDIIIIIMGIQSFIEILLKNKNKKSDLYGILFIFIVFLYMIINLKQGLQIILSARTYIIPILIYFIGRSIPHTTKNIEYSKKFIIKLGIFLIITSLIDVFIIPIELWGDIVNIPKFNKDIKGMPGIYSLGNLPGNIYTAGVRRALGVAGDPLLLSYFLIPITLSVYSIIILSKHNKLTNDIKYNKKYIIILMLLIFVQALTISRAVLISESIVMVCATLFISSKYRLSQKNILILIAIFIIASIFALEKILHIIINTITFNDGGSTLTHIYSFMKGLEYVSQNIFGSGVGTASTAISATGTSNMGVENAYFNLIIETGILGFITFFLFWISCIKTALKESKLTNYKWIYICSYMSSLIFIITGMFSPQLWTMKTVILLWFIVGVSQNMYFEKEYIK